MLTIVNGKGIEIAIYQSSHRDTLENLEAHQESPDVSAGRVNGLLDIYLSEVV